jgi:hypothetical protein
MHDVQTPAAICEGARFPTLFWEKSARQIEALAKHRNSSRGR